MTSAEAILKQVQSLSPLPGTLTRLITVLDNPTSSVDDIVDVIRYDEAITTQILKLCNSAYFGLSRQVGSLKDAVRFLGTTKVLQILMAVHGKSLLSNGQRGYGLDPGVLWRHSVAVSLASATIARMAGLENVNLASTAGLLHDVGKSVLNEYVGREFAAIGDVLASQKFTFCEAEKLVLGYSHDEIGALVAEKWLLPESIVRCIRYHHNPEDLLPPDPIVDVVYVANCLCLSLGIGLGADELNYRSDPAVQQRLALSRTTLEAAGAQVIDDLSLVEQALVSPADPPSPAETHATTGGRS